MSTYEFNVAMTCEGCANAVKKVLGKLGDQVTSVQTDVENKKVVVTTTLSQKEIQEELEKTGKAVSPL